MSEVIEPAGARRDAVLEVHSLDLTKSTGVEKAMEKQGMKE